MLLSLRFGVTWVPVSRTADRGIQLTTERTGAALVDAERDAVLAAAGRGEGQEVGGPAGAAARLGMKRTTLQSKMKKLGDRTERRHSGASRLASHNNATDRQQSRGATGNCGPEVSSGPPHFDVPRSVYFPTWGAEGSRHRRPWRSPRSCRNRGSRGCSRPTTSWRSPGQRCWNSAFPARGAKASGSDDATSSRSKRAS